MTQVWPFCGEAPVPTLVSSYWRPLGVFVIWDSLFFSVPAAGVGLGSSARANAAGTAARSATERIRFRFVMFFAFLAHDSVGAAGVYQYKFSSPLPSGERGVGVRGRGVGVRGGPPYDAARVSQLRRTGGIRRARRRLLRARRRL